MIADGSETLDGVSASRAVKIRAIDLFVPVNGIIATDSS
jgi:hypothetical protein